jgi:O-antigen/teichoic acid export membrane protein
VGLSIRKIKNMASEKRSIITLVGGTTVAQGLSLLFAPATTRLFSPDVFGELSIFTSITSIIIVVICLRYELSIVVAEDDMEGFSLLAISLLFAFLLTVLFGMVFFLLRG